MKILTHMITSNINKKLEKKSKIITTEDLPAWIVYVVHEGVFQYFLSGLHFSPEQATEAIKKLPATTECKIERYVKPNFLNAN